MRVGLLLSLIAVALGSRDAAPIAAYTTRGLTDLNERNITTSVVVHGLRLAMFATVPGTLPRSALLRVRVRVSNVSGHVVELERLCDRANPDAVVTNGHGVVVYATIRTWPVAQRCSRQPTVPLSPGRSLERQNYVILRGPEIVPAVYIVDSGRRVRLAGKGYQLPVSPTYRPPQVAAVLADGTRIPLPGGRGAVPLFKARRIRWLEVGAVGPTSGPLLAIGSAICAGQQIVLPRWRVIVRTGQVGRITAPCPRPRLWLIDFGWAGGSIGEVTVGVGNLLPTP